jgi:hypothetical protein
LIKFLQAVLFQKRMVRIILSSIVLYILKDLFIGIPFFVT